MKETDKNSDSLHTTPYFLDNFSFHKKHELASGKNGSTATYAQYKCKGNATSVYICIHCIYNVNIWSVVIVS